MEELRDYDATAGRPVVVDLRDLITGTAGHRRSVSMRTAGTGQRSVRRTGAATSAPAQGASQHLQVQAAVDPVEEMDHDAHSVRQGSPECEPSPNMLANPSGEQTLQRLLHEVAQLTTQRQQQEKQLEEMRQEHARQLRELQEAVFRQDAANQPSGSAHARVEDAAHMQTAPPTYADKVQRKPVTATLNYGDIPKFAGQLAEDYPDFVSRLEEWYQLH